VVLVQPRRRVSSPIEPKVFISYLRPLSRGLRSYRRSLWQHPLRIQNEQIGVTLVMSAAQPPSVCRVTEMSAKVKARIKLSIVLGSGAQIGPDKAALLESIRDTGSISGAARDLGMQYKRAWMLLDNVNRAFKRPVVKSIIGGAYAGAVLTPFGVDVLERYRRIVAVAEKAAARDLVILNRAALPRPRPRV